MAKDTLLLKAQKFSEPFYKDEKRYYHNLEHIQYMLHVLEERANLDKLSASVRERLLLSVWGHDLIYNPRKKNNEECSAKEFNRWLRTELHTQGSEYEPLCNDITRLILATKHTHPPQYADEALLMDADLSILAAPTTQFEQYERAIRQEYQHVPTILYRIGRSQILKSFLNREHIFYSPEFADLETKARDHLKYSLTELLKGS